MSEENVEIVRRACDAWLQGDIGEVFDYVHAQLEWDTTHFEDWVESRVIRGREQVRRFLEDEWLGSWENYEAGIDRIRDAGEDMVLVLWWQRMKGRGSGVPVSLNSAQVWTVRDGLVLRIANYTDQTKAIEAAGLSE